MTKFANRAPAGFCSWLSGNVQKDEYGREYRYHPRSDSHSKAMARVVIADLCRTVPQLRAASTFGLAFAINCRFTFPGTQKAKTVDVALGKPQRTIKEVLEGVPLAEKLDELILSCELKAVMTEHGKAQPRVFDELSSSHDIVHRSLPHAIAAGLTVVNIAPTFISPLRQFGANPPTMTKHKQPHATRRMVEHLRGLPIRGSATTSGFDAYATIVISCDNENAASLHEELPAPQPGESDHYDTFMDRLGKAVTARIGNAPTLP